MIDISAKPYYDDFEPSKNYHKVLFIPSRPIQARELTQIQSTIQEQIKRHGDYIFKNGSMLIPGLVSFLDNVTVIKLESLYNNIPIDTYLSQIIGQKIVGATSGVKATVIHAEHSTVTDSACLFITYFSGNTTSDGTSYSAFVKNEVLTTEGNQSVYILNSTDFSGVGSLAVINEGVYYVNGYYVQNAEQIINVEKTKIYGSYQIGFEIKESIVTADDDITLYDNANGFYNDTMRGADRLKIELVLTKKDYFQTLPEREFVPLMWIKDGVLQDRTTTTKLSHVGDLLANRTYNESGDYIVDAFDYTVQCYRSNKRGEWKTNIAYIKNDIVFYEGKYFRSLTDGTSGVIPPVVEYGEVSDGNVTWLMISAPKYNGGYYTPADTDSLETNLANQELGLVKISNGKAYIKGYEINVIEGYRSVTFNKARDYDQTKNYLSPVTGQYFTVDTVRGLPSLSLDSYNLVNNNGDTVGTCRIRNFEYVESGIYNVGVIDVAVNSGYNFKQDAKGIFKTDQFSCKIIGTRKLLSGSVTNSSASTAVTGDGTIFTAELKANDTIVLNNVTYTIASITNAIQLVTTSNIVLANSNIPIYLEYTELHGSPELYQSLPHDVIRTIRDANNICQTNYIVNRFVQQQAVGGKLIITLPAVNESFVSSNANLYNVALADGSSAPESPTIELTGLNNSQLIISGLIGTNSTYNIVFAVQKTQSQEKKKVRKYKTIELNTLATIDLPEIKLTECDVSNIIKITQSGSNEFDYTKRNEVKAYNALSESIITNYYKLNTNTGTSYFDVSFITPQGSFIPSAPIRITYEYYDHTVGDYFSVDSHEDTYQTSLLDFRSRISDSGIDFTGTGASISEPLNTSHYVEVEYSYYLPRRDIVQLDPTGTFRIEEGVSDLNPSAPVPNDNNIVIAYVDLVPYTLNCRNTIAITKNTVKRYTMNDIGMMANRLSNVESAMALNLTEKRILKTEIQDEYGLNRYKSGFIVDGFKTVETGGYDNPDYKVSVDIMVGECRPPFVATDLRLLENTGAARISNHYQVTGEMVTLPYTETPLIQNLQASTPENITPLTHLSTMRGTLSLYPSYDTWMNTSDLPDIYQRSAGSFNSEVQVATQLGILGIVWNAWQETARVTTDSTTTISSTTSTVMQAGIAGAGTTGATTTTTTTTIKGTDAVTQYHSGTETFAQESWDQLGTSTGIVDSVWTPYAREKAVVLYLKKTMPNINVSVKIDQYDVSQYFTPALSLTYTSKVGSFLDYKDSSISHDNLMERQFGNNQYDIIEKSEVIRGLTSKATAIVVATESSMLKVINVKGTFTVGETVRGTISGATAVISAKSQNILRTSNIGTLYGVLLIPNNDMIKFLSQALTVSVLSADKESVQAFFQYDAHGLNLQKQTTIMSIKNAIIVNRKVEDSRTITENWTRVASTSTTLAINCDCDCNCNCACSGGSGGGGEPLAQTISHNNGNGVFLTSIDLYFYSVKQDPTSPIFIHLVDVVNGYPGSTIVPFSHVTKAPSEVNYSTTKLIPTNFKFESPVYLRPDVEYSIVVGSNFDFTNETKVWTSKLGAVALNGQTITQQPLIGSLFMAQTASTWTTDQMSDLCFTAYKAKFDIQRYGHIQLMNQDLDYVLMDADSFKVVAGSKTVRVLHFNHGLKNGDLVSFIDAPSQFNGTFKVSNTTIDSFTITTTAAAATSGWIGGTTSKILCNRKYDLMYLNGNDFVVPQTHIAYTYKPVDDNNTQSTMDYPIQVRQNMFNDFPQYVLSEINEAEFTNGIDSFYIDAYLYSDSEDVSPMIDLTSYSVHIISNRLNNESSVTNQTVDLDTIINAATLTGGFVFSSAGSIKITDSAYFDEFDAVKVGKFVVFSGTANNNTSFLITKKYYDGTNYFLYTSSVVISETTSGSVTMKQYDLYTDSIAATSSSNAFNYVTKIIELRQSSSGFRLALDYCRPVDSYINVYYKTVLKSDYTSISTEPWTLISNSSFHVTGRDEFIEKTIDMEVDIFDQIMVKVEFKGDNSSQPPRMRNFRLIALA